MRDNDDNIVVYFKRNQWKNFTDIEKNRYRNMYKMYTQCLTQGFQPAKPDFMSDKKPTYQKNYNKNKIKKKIKKRIRLKKLPPKKYPKRKLPPIDYNEREVVKFDSYIYCDDCQEEFEKFCPKCGTLLHILNKKVRKGVKNRAKKTLPEILQIKKSKIHGQGVFALKKIPKGIKFGPYDGLESVKSSTGYAWKIRGGKLLDAVQVEYSNWLRYVNCARNISEQNLIAYQFEGNIYYRSVKKIEEGEELLVFYGEEFARMLNVDSNKYFIPTIQEDSCLEFSSEQNLMMKCYKNCPDNKPDEGIVPCPFCRVYLVNIECLKKHLKNCRQKFNVFPDWSKVPNKELLQERYMNQEYRYKCTKCNYKTNVNSNLTVHFRIHTGEKPFKCLVCDKRFTQSDKLKNHILLHIDAKQYACEYCSRRFNTADYLSRHIKIKHTLQKNFCCNYCSYKAVFSNSVIRHLRTHICKEEFTKNDHLQKHLKLHRRHFLFNCQFCHCEWTMNAHKRKHVI